MLKNVNGLLFEAALKIANVDFSGNEIVDLDDLGFQTQGKAFEITFMCLLSVFNPELRKNFVGRIVAVLLLPLKRFRVKFKKSAYLIITLI